MIRLLDEKVRTTPGVGESLVENSTHFSDYFLGGLPRRLRVAEVGYAARARGAEHRGFQ